MTLRSEGSRESAGPVDPAGRPLVPVLAYHAVADDPPAPIRRWSVTPARLREHLDALRELDAHALTVTELLACYRGERPLPARPVLLTFDDGYEDFLLDALPALTAAGYPATLYVSTGLVRDERPVLHTLPGRMLSWEQVGKVAAAGIEIGAHSHTHRELDTLSRAEAAWEVAHSRSRLQDELGQPVRTFAYPYGYSTAHVRAAVRDAGYEAAFGVRNAYSHAGEDTLALSRILVERDLDAAALARLVTERVAPVGWRGEKATTRAWRAYRRAKVLRATVTGAAGAPAPVAVRAPIDVRDVELARPLPEQGPAEPGGGRARRRRVVRRCSSGCTAARSARSSSSRATPSPTSSPHGCVPRSTRTWPPTACPGWRRCHRRACRDGRTRSGPPARPDRLARLPDLVPPGRARGRAARCPRRRPRAPRS